MANGETKARIAAERKAKKHFHGNPCETSFWVNRSGIQIKNPATKRKSPWKGANNNTKRNRQSSGVVDLLAA